MNVSIRTIAGVVALGVMVLSAAPVAAQNWQGGLDFQVGFPTGDYKDQIDQTGFGISGDILWSPHGAPFGLGFSANWMQVGSETRKEPFSTTIPDVTVDVETENALAQFLFVLRAQPKFGDIRPYADGLIGWNYLYTQTRIRNASNGEEVASSTNFDDNAFAFGFGGGILGRVYSGTQGGSGRPLLVFIDLGFRYVIGGEADYLKEGSIRRENGLVRFDVTRSKTNVAVVRVGVGGSY